MHLYNTAAELTRIMGHKNPDQFFNDPSAINPQTGQLLHPPPAPPAPPPDPKLLAALLAAGYRALRRYARPKRDTPVLAPRRMVGLPLLGLTIYIPLERGSGALCQ